MTMRSFVASPTGIGTGRRKIFFCPRPFRELGIIRRDSLWGGGTEFSRKF
jgi:hypothetical protein